eukprot:1191273-Prorocentrum_minimum.AAC.1
MHILSIFDCRELQGGWYLYADLSKECYTEEHLMYLLVGAVALALFPVGVPLFYIATFVKLELWDVVRQKEYSLYLYHACVQYVSRHAAGMPNELVMPVLPEHVIVRCANRMRGESIYLQGGPIR